MSVISDFSDYIRTLKEFRRFLSDTVSIEEALDEIPKKAERREENFLEFVRRGVYENKVSPFLRVLKSADLEFDDVKSIARKEGVEGTLKELLERRVYIRIDEFKGKVDCVRNGKKFRFKESDFDNIMFRSGVETTSGASRSPGTRVVVDFNSLEEEAKDFIVFLHVHNLLDMPQVMWLPTGLGLLTTLRYGKLGNTPLEWFSQIKWSPSVGRVNFYSVFKNAMMSESMKYEARMMGCRLPTMRFADFENIRLVIRSISKLVGEHSRCCVSTYPSSALRACKFAMEEGIDMRGVVFLVVGEPLTPKRKREVEKAGAKIIPWYAAAETGAVSFGCGRPSHCDDMHMITNNFAVIQYEREVEGGVNVDAFLLTSLLPTARKFLLNVEMGDYGIIDKTRCGCGFEKLGFSNVVYNLRSFEKLTGEGMTLIGSDMVEVIEEDLPTMFGGSSTDYQIVEEEDEHGFTHMDILVNPEVGEVDEKKVVDAIYEGLARRSKVRNESFDVWKDAGTIRVREEKPIITRGGKIFSFQISKIRKKK